MYETSDTLIVKNALETALLENLTDQEDKDEGEFVGEQIANVMAKFHNAEFACLVVKKNNIYYCRDRWGKGCQRGHGSVRGVL